MSVEAERYREDLLKHLQHGNPGGSGNTLGQIPRKEKVNIREVARILTMANPKIRARIQRDFESGQLDSGLFRELLHYGYGVPKKVIEVEPGQGMVRMALRKPIGYDPLNPDKPNVKVMERMMAAAARDAVLEASEEPPDAPEMPPTQVSIQSIVPRRDLLAAASAGTEGAGKRATEPPKPHLEDDGAIPLRVDWV